MPVGCCYPLTWGLTCQLVLEVRVPVWSLTPPRETHNSRDVLSVYGVFSFGFKPLLLHPFSGQYFPEFAGIFRTPVTCFAQRTGTSTLLVSVVKFAYLFVHCATKVQVPRNRKGKRKKEKEKKWKER